MSLKESDRTEVSFDSFYEGLPYIEDNRVRLVADYLVERTTQFIDNESNPDRLALAFLANHALKATENKIDEDGVYLNASEGNAQTHDRIRAYLGSITALLHGRDPEKFYVKPIRWDEAESLTTFEFGSGKRDRLVAKHKDFHDVRYGTGVDCAYIFRGRPSNTEVEGVFYRFNLFSTIPRA